MKYILLMTVAAMMCFNLCGETLRFRSGKVLHAELTAAKIKISNKTGIVNGWKKNVSMPAASARINAK